MTIIEDIDENFKIGANHCRLYDAQWQQIKSQLSNATQQVHDLIALVKAKDEALNMVARGPLKPMPDAHAHSWEAFAKAWLAFSTDCKFAAIKALSLKAGDCELVEVVQVEKVTGDIFINGNHRTEFNRGMKHIQHGKHKLYVIKQGN